MDDMAANGIKVILDIPGLPAPIWLHRKYPGVNVVTQNGSRSIPRNVIWKISAIPIIDAYLLSCRD